MIFYSMLIFIALYVIYGRPFISAVLFTAHSPTMAVKLFTFMAETGAAGLVLWRYNREAARHDVCFILN